MRKIIPAASEISSAVVKRLKEMRMEDRAIASGTPMPSRTRDGSRAPEEQAEPWLTARPSKSSAVFASKLTLKDALEIVKVLVTQRQPTYEETVEMFREKHENREKSRLVRLKQQADLLAECEEF